MSNADFVPRKVPLGFLIHSTESKANKHGQTEPQDVRQQGRTWSKVYLGEVREEGEEHVSDHLLARDLLMAAVFLHRIYRKRCERGQTLAEAREKLGRRGWRWIHLMRRWRW